MNACLPTCLPAYHALYRLYVPSPPKQITNVQVRPLVRAVHHDEDCDVAVAKLRALVVLGRKIAFDSEYLPTVRQSEVVQLCASDEVFIFWTGRWPS